MLSTKFTEQERSLVYKIADEVMADSVARGLSNAHGLGIRERNMDLLGAVGPVAFCKLFNISFDRIARAGSFKDADIKGTNIQIRTVDKWTNSLIIRPNDKDEDVFVLMVLYDMEINCVGWIVGAQAKNSLYVKAPNGRPPAWFVPQRALNSPESLVNLI